MTAGPTIGLWGHFDVDSLDALTRLRVARFELERRRPDCLIRNFAPFGSTRAVAVAAGEPVEPLAPITESRIAALAQELAAIVVLGEITDAHHYNDHPPADPRDVEDACALMQNPPAGPKLGSDTTAAHPGLLARRVWSYALCEQRREFLRAMHWWPQHGAAVVVQSSAQPAATVAALVRNLPDSTPVTLLEAEPGDEDFAATTASLLGERALRMPARQSSIEDRVAAIAGARYVVSSDPASLAIADSFGRDRAPLADFAIGTSPAAMPIEVVRRDEAGLDAMYDALAGLAVGHVRGQLVDPEIIALKAALDARGRRLAHERIVLADYVRAVRNNTRAEIATLEAQRRVALRARLAARFRKP